MLLDASAQHSGRTGREVLTLTAMVLGVGRSRVGELLELVGLSRAAARKRVGGYSLGMRQRLGIAHALLGEPRVLILDEPANGLDPEGIAWMRKLLRDFADRAGTVLLSSHLLREVEAIADHLIVIDNGRIVAQGLTSELLAATGVVVRAIDPDALHEALADAGLVATPGSDGALLVEAEAEAVGRAAAAAGARPARAAARRHRRARGAVPVPDLQRPRGGPDLMSHRSLARPPLPRLTRVELRKSADTRAGFWLMLVLVLLAAAVVVLQAVFAEDIDRNFEPLLSSAIQVVSVILPGARHPARDQRVVAAHRADDVRARPPA